MKKILFPVLMSLVVSACSIKASDDKKDGTNDGLTDKWPAYTEQPLAGKVFGQDWKALTAVARLSQGSTSTVTVSFYADSPANACSSGSFSSLPAATVMIPANYAVTEYKADLTQLSARSAVEQYPLVFSSLGVVSKNVVATRTKMRITAIDESGFTALTYANSDDQGEMAAEINGQIHVIDCRKVVDFSEWTKLTGFYKLQSFDGVTQDLRTVSIQEDKDSKYYDNKSNQYVRAMALPLFYSVSGGSSQMFAFGPMDILGLTLQSGTETSKSLKYSYSGPLNYDNKDLNLILDLTATIEGPYLYIGYTIEIPGMVKRTSHQITLVKAK